MPKYSMTILFKNSCVRESVEVEAESPNEALAECDTRVSQMIETIRRREKRNVFVSKEPCGCEAATSEDQI